MVDPLGVIGVVGVVYDIAKDIYALHQQYQNNKATLEELASFVQNTGDYVKRLQDPSGIDIRALGSLSVAFETAKKRLICLKTELRGGWRDIGIYNRIRDIDAELQKAFNDSLLLASVELGQSLTARAAEIERRLSNIEHAVNRIEKSLRDPDNLKWRQSLAQLSKEMDVLKSLRDELSSRPLESMTQDGNLDTTHLNVRVREVDKRITVVSERLRDSIGEEHQEHGTLECDGDDQVFRTTSKPNQTGATSRNAKQSPVLENKADVVDGPSFFSLRRARSAGRAAVQVSNKFRSILAEQKAKFWKPIRYHFPDRAAERVGRSRSESIDLRIQQDAVMLRKEVEILCLGIDNSEISAVMKIIHQDSTTEETLAHRPTIAETRFTMGPLRVRTIELDIERCWCTKLFNHFESVTCIIFCAALSDYDEMNYGDGNTNRLKESLRFFGEMASSRWFLRTSIILILTKVDLLKKKLPKVPLERFFVEYNGGSDCNKAAKFILWMFMQRNRAHLSVYPHIMNEIGISVNQFVHAAVTETVLNSLKT